MNKSFKSFFTLFMLDVGKDEETEGRESLISNSHLLFREARSFGS